MMKQNGQKDFAEGFVKCEEQVQVNMAKMCLTHQRHFNNA